MKYKIFVNVVANLLLVMVVFCVASVVLGGGIVSVFGNSSNAPICKGNSKEGISFVFALHGSGEYVLDILAILEKYNAKCTFFVTGDFVARNSGIVKEILQAGNEVGISGYFATDLKNCTAQQVCESISASQKILTEQVGFEAFLFYPPFGSYGDLLVTAVTNSGMKFILFSRYAASSNCNSADVVVNIATKEVGGGEIVLFEPSWYVKNALERAIKILLQNNFEIITVGKNIQD